MANFTDEEVIGYKKSIGVTSAAVSVMRTDMAVISASLAKIADPYLLATLANVTALMDIIEAATNNELLTPDIKEMPVVSLTWTDEPVLD